MALLCTPINPATFAQSDEIDRPIPEIKRSVVSARLSLFADCNIVPPFRDRNYFLNVKWGVKTILRKEYFTALRHVYPNCFIHYDLNPLDMCTETGMESLDSFFFVFVFSFLFF